MLTSTTKRNIYRIIPFGVIWLVFSVVYTLLERGLLSHLTYYPATGNPYNFIKNIFITPITALVTGLLIGTFEILYFNKLFATRTFTKKIIYKSAAYLIIIALFIISLSAISNVNELHQSFFSKQVWDNVLLFVFDYSFFSVTIYIGSIIVVSQFYNEVSENIGQGVLLNFFTGKYHRPTEEERIFMFLDMKSSTTIAEHAGHIQYFELLKEYYSDLSAPIVEHSGEIYQYVGDEIVVSWKTGEGLKNNNCIQCFFAMKDSVQKQAVKYNQKFGVLPEFKAGFHIGKVTTGEIGALKKEIIFTGDVLNTTARIQGLCNAYQSDILISGTLLKKLSLENSFQIRSLGENELRGRGEKIELFTITANK
jgi:class 3 adenylate cyclase